MRDMGPECITPDEEQQEFIAALADKERLEAYEATARAIASYRWWGFTSILCAVRMFITGIKLRLGMKLWP